ncbi:hypothetical protein Rhopal_007204-T1 [Rhodotorula paludigena]|uniref:Fe2OG dioxygenase domain-containing protein n=1 Tax=Rhodotorula paludigena TaxID=86838 RepID=A0AAV5GNH5_9BASI|nr:hypothetical protein Rhopal_007204-T1 [Rhodotorula paludigena]
MSKFVDYTGKERAIRSAKGRAAGAFDEVPVIDIRPAIAEGASDEARAAVAAQIKHAGENVGFMYLAGHGIPEEVQLKAFQQARLFFEQDLGAKRQLDFKKSPVFRGYEGLAGNAQGDRKEAFNWGYEPSADPLNPSNEDVVEDATAGSGKNVWPSLDSPAGGLRDAILDYYGQALVLGRKVIRLFALALDLPEDTFDKSFAVPGVLGRILHYPPQPPSDAEAIGVNQHTDIEILTLNTEKYNTQAGEWLEVPPIPGTLVCNVGDMLARWTNDRFISTVHRVVNRTGQQRYSMPCFFGPNYSTMIETFSQCLAPGETSKYEPIRAGEVGYVWRRLARSRLGRKYDEKEKLEDAVKIDSAVPVTAVA